MRGSVLGSGGVHLALLVVLLVVRTPAARIVPGPDIVQVALLDPAAAVPAVPKVEPPPEETPKETIQPVEEEGIKLDPPKKKKPPKPEPEEKPRETPRTAPALPSAPAGAAGLRGDVAVDAGDFEFTYYLVLLRNRVASNWQPPAGLATAGKPARAVVYFKVSRGGEVSAVRLETASGVEFFDRSASRAVILSDPLPPLPLGFTGSDLGVHFGFEWESP